MIYRDGNYSTNKILAGIVLFQGASKNVGKNNVKYTEKKTKL